MKRPSVTPAAPRMTIVLLNYKRPQNIPVILESIRRQSVGARVFLWNNGTADVDCPMIDRYEASRRNVGCMARWKLAREAETPYVMSLDDDICFDREDALEDVIGALEAQDDPRRIVGVCGASFGHPPFYTQRRDHECRIGHRNLSRSPEPVCGDAAADVIKGRVMAFRRELLDGVPLPEEREDDIYLSSVCANRARGFHRVPLVLNDAFRELPELGVGSWFDVGHFRSRDRALRAYFSSGGLRDGSLVRYLVLAPYILKILILRRLHLLS